MTSEHREIVTPATTEVVTTFSPAAAVDRTTATAYDPYAGQRQAALSADAGSLSRIRHH
jgi:hypothetical protein